VAIADIPIAAGLLTGINLSVGYTSIGGGVILADVVLVGRAAIGQPGERVHCAAFLKNDFPAGR